MEVEKYAQNIVVHAAGLNIYPFMIKCTFFAICIYRALTMSHFHLISCSCDGIVLI